MVHELVHELLRTRATRAQSLTEVAYWHPVRRT